VKSLFHLRARDMDYDFRLVRCEVLGSISLTCRSRAICVDLMRQIEMRGLWVLETPLHHYQSPHSRSQFFHLGPIVRMFEELRVFSFQRCCWEGAGHPRKDRRP
jgi:hypothetical protein